MIDSLERIRVKLIIHLTWKLSRKRMLRSLNFFSSTEADSAWQLMHAYESVSNPEMKAEIFEQILEETSHAEEFSDLCRALSPDPVLKQHYERKAIHNPKDEIWMFLAYCYVGEAQACRRFKHISASLKDGPVKAALDRIIEDESGHVDLAGDLLHLAKVPKNVMDRHILKVKVIRAVEAWVRMGKNAGDGLSTVLLTATYFLIGPFFKYTCRRVIEGPSARAV